MTITGSWVYTDVVVFFSVQIFFDKDIYDSLKNNIFTCFCWDSVENGLLWRYSPALMRWWYTLVNFHWARVRFGPVPLASCGNGSIVNSPAAVSFTVLSQTPRRPSYFQSSTIAFDNGLLLKAKMPIRDLTTELESRSNMDPSDILD